MTSRASAHDATMLAALVEQARLQGADLATLRALVEEASDRGAVRALARCGLQDDDAGHDIRELRDLLEAWHVARLAAWRTLGRWAITALIALIVAGST